MAENKTKPTAAQVSTFIAALPDAARQKDARKIVKWMEQLAGEKAKMWGSAIIGVGCYHYKYESGREGDMPLIAFSPRKSATVLYNLIGFSGARDYLTRLGKHTTGKGCLYVKKLADVDEKILKDLMARSLAASKARVSS